MHTCCEPFSLPPLPTLGTPLKLCFESRRGSHDPTLLEPPGAFPFYTTVHSASGLTEPCRPTRRSHAHVRAVGTTCQTARAKASVREIVRTRARSPAHRIPRRIHHIGVSERAANSAPHDGSAVPGLADPCRSSPHPGAVVGAQHRRRRATTVLLSRPPAHIGLATTLRGPPTAIF